MYNGSCFVQSRAEIALRWDRMYLSLYDNPRFPTHLYFLTLLPSYPVTFTFSPAFCY